ncbi:MAG: metal ABC transporter permease [Pseudomonadota bacterium]
MGAWLVPFTYDYMLKAILVSAIVGGACGLLSAYLMLKGWSLIGDALAHAIVPGVALAYLLALPYALGAFVAGLLAAAAIGAIRVQTTLRQDAILGIVFTSFFAAGLLIASLYPTSINIQTIVLGNILAISDADVIQVVAICVIVMAFIALKWRDLMVVFFDENHARSVGVSPRLLNALFFALLAAAIVAALQAVGAVLVLALVVTPGATAYLLSDRFSRVLLIAAGFGAVTSAAGAYLSYFLDGATGGVIVVLQTVLFLAAFIAAPRHGLLAARRSAAAVVAASGDGGVRAPPGGPA